MAAWQQHPCRGPHCKYWAQRFGVVEAKGSWGVAIVGKGEHLGNLQCECMGYRVRNLHGSKGFV